MAAPKTKPTSKNAHPQRRRLAKPHRAAKAERPAAVVSKSAEVRAATTGPGRPSKYTPNTVAAIIEAIELHGASPSGAGRVLGLHPQTISDWRAQYPEFSDEIEAAYERRRRNLLATVTTSKDGPRWLLEREYREQYGKPEATTTINVKAEANAGASAGIALSADELAELQKARATALGKGQAQPVKE